MHLNKELDLESVDGLVEIFAEFSGIDEGKSLLDAIEFSVESSYSFIVGLDNRIVVIVFSLEISFVIFMILGSLSKEIFVAANFV